MKHLYHVVTLLLMLPVSSAAQRSKTQLRSLDALINDPFARNMLTTRAYRKSVFKDQQAIGGNIIKEGGAVGSSATVDDKSVTVNIGLPMIKRSLAIQPVFKGSSSEGFVRVFDKEGYGRTLGGGISFLLFMSEQNKSIYKEEERITLHRKLRQLRYSNEGVQIYPTEKFDPPAPKKMWHDPTTPNKPDVWAKEVNDKISLLLSTREIFLNELDDLAHIDGVAAVDRYYDNKIKQAEVSLDADLKISYIKYLEAYKNVADILPNYWKIDNKAEENILINDSLSLTALHHTAWLDATRLRNDEQLRKHSLAVYDTIQLKAKWAVKKRVWWSLNTLYNVAKQPVFNYSLADKGYKESRYDEYIDIRLAYNWIWIRPKNKTYFSIGSTSNNMRVFVKDSLKTYQSLKSQVINGQTIQVVNQNELYPQMPDKVFYSGWQLQFATYFLDKIGLDVTSKGLYPMGDNTQEALYGATFGIFVPIKSGESTLLLMPQLRWDTVDDSKPWSVGFNLSASIPSFATKSEK